MPAYVRIDRPGDERLRDYVGLTDVALRRRLEPAEGLFVAEGEKVIRRAAAAGYPVRSVLLEEKWVAALADLLEGLDVPVYVAARSTLESVTGYDVHRGALAAMDRLPLPSPADLLARSARVVVLEDVNDHANVGAVFRAAAGLGMDAVLVTPRCADPFYRRAVKVSMGAVFSVPWARFGRWPHDLETVRAAGFRLLALTPDVDADPIDDLAPAPTDRLALLLGSEGDGLDRRTLAAADVRVRIPMTAGVDSLNVGAAAAVACYALRRPTNG
jgi:tRNA G18 (ribose-2'-O)-methylase SpoU